jgi:hypothetical protein
MSTRDCASVSIPFVPFSHACRPPLPGYPPRSPRLCYRVELPSYRAIEAPSYRTTDQPTEPRTYSAAIDFHRAYAHTVRCERQHINSARDGLPAGVKETRSFYRCSCIGHCMSSCASWESSCAFTAAQKRAG